MSLTETYPHFSAWLHSLTSIDVLAAIGAAGIVVYIALGRPR